MWQSLLKIQIVTNNPMIEAILPNTVSVGESRNVTTLFVVLSFPVLAVLPNMVDRIPPAQGLMRLPGQEVLFFRDRALNPLEICYADTRDVQGRVSVPVKCK